MHLRDGGSAAGRSLPALVCRREHRFMTDHGLAALKDARRAGSASRFATSDAWGGERSVSPSRRSRHCSASWAFPQRARRTSRQAWSMSSKANGVALLPPVVVADEAAAPSPYTSICRPRGREPWTWRLVLAKAATCMQGAADLQQLETSATRGDRTCRTLDRCRSACRKAITGSPFLLGEEDASTVLIVAPDACYLPAGFRGRRVRAEQFGLRPCLGFGRPALFAALRPQLGNWRFHRSEGARDRVGRAWCPRDRAQPAARAVPGRAAPCQPLLAVEPLLPERALSRRRSDPGFCRMRRGADAGAIGGVCRTASAMRA